VYEEIVSPKCKSPTSGQELFINVTVAIQTDPHAVMVLIGEGHLCTNTVVRRVSRKV